MKPLENPFTPQSPMLSPDILGQVTRSLAEVRNLEMDQSELDCLAERISSLGAQAPFHFWQDAEIKLAAQRLLECADKLKRWDA